MVCKADGLNITVLNNNVKINCLTGRNAADSYAVDGLRRDTRVASAAYGTSTLRSRAAAEDGPRGPDFKPQLVSCRNEMKAEDAENAKVGTHRLPCMPWRQRAGASAMSFKSSLVSCGIRIQHQFMNIKRLSVAFAVVSFLPLLAHAQTGEASGGSSPLANFFWTVGPFVIIGVLFYFFFVRAINKNKKRSDDYIASQKQHNERVEQVLERIATALEQKDKDAV